MIHYIQGDLFETNATIIAHGCNCQGVMGSGVAKLVRDQYPEAYQRYLEKYEQEGWRLGEVQFVAQPNGKWIANCATQDEFLPRGICHANYDAIRACMIQLKTFARDRGLSIAMPKIGAGLAGGDWNVIESILNEVFTDFEVSVYCL